ncbi:MAG: hypothetical protein JXA87_04140 [Thermoleophilia bacterium]|nr:hypothetical protein [Thermoleophilia bacterium]
MTTTKTTVLLARSAWLIAMAASLALIPAALGGCAKVPPPSGQPSIRGSITSVTRGSDGLGAILVEEASPQGLDYDKASLRITKDTEFLRRVGADYVEITFDDIVTGMLVEAWITGPVAESYPVQAAADTVVQLE